GGGGDDGMGIGASVALGIADHDATATVGDGATFTVGESNDVALNASGTHTMDTKAVNGAAGGTGIGGAVAVSITNNDTAATLQADTLSSPALDIGGKLELTADHSSTATTLADGNASGD